MQVEGRNLLQNAGPMRAPVERRNMSKYCKFHKDKGHDMTECFQLRDKIEALIQGGFLRKYISRLVTTGLQNANVPRSLVPANNASTSNPSDGPPHEVRTISGGHAAGDSAKARKDSVRLAQDIAMGHQINMAEHVAKLSRRENMVISFIDDEARRLIHPHTDALVVTLSTANGKGLPHLDRHRELCGYLVCLCIPPDECKGCQDKANQDTIVWIWRGKGLCRRSHPTVGNLWTTLDADHVDDRLSPGRPTF